MKIAYITDTWLPEMNPVAQVAARTVNYLRARGHTVQVVRPHLPATADIGTKNSSPSDPSSIDTDAPHASSVLADLYVASLKMPGYRYRRMGLPAHRTMIKHWRKMPPDVIHIATAGPLGWSACKAAQALGIATTSDFNNSRFGLLAHRGLNRMLDKFLFAGLRAFHQATDLTLAATVEQCNFLQNVGLGNVEMSERGVDVELFSPLHRSSKLRQSWGLKKDALADGNDAEATPAILYAGRLSTEKNLPLVFRTFEQIKRSIPAARLIMAGDGPLREELEQDYPDVIFTGELDAKQMAAHYASADVLLVPSLGSSYGLATIEAMASGLPVVAFDCGAAHQHIRDGVHGYINEYGDDIAFMRSACELAAQAALRQRMSIAARRSIESSRWENVLARFESLLKEVSMLKTQPGITKLANI